MAKIGRNDPCPCGSGKKFKRCCGNKASEEHSGKGAAQPEQAPRTLTAAIEQIQAKAKEHASVFVELGVFLLFSTDAGDAWVLEVTESDAIKVAEKGEPVEISLEENPETIVVNCSHTFAIEGKELIVTSYTDQALTQHLQDAPAQQINAAMRRIKKRFSAEFLSQVHVSQ